MFSTTAGYGDGSVTMRGLNVFRHELNLQFCNIDKLSVHISGGRTSVGARILRESRALLNVTLLKQQITKECLGSLLTRSLTKITPPPLPNCSPFTLFTE